MKPAIATLALALLVAPIEAQPVRVILVGDSTLATRSGYGDALCQRFRPDVACINLARGGRSSGSFRAEGLWDGVQDLLREGSTAYRSSYVLIQFGHNDQPGKPGRSTDLVTEFPANMARYLTEVKALGGVPVLLTPLTRRSFKAGVLQNDLRPWAEAGIRVAAGEQAPLLDLNALSHAAVQAVGEDESDTLAMAAKPSVGAPALPSSQSERAGAANPIFDRTHLGDKGARVFSALVAQELVRLQPDLKHYLKAEP